MYSKILIFVTYEVQKEWIIFCPVKSLICEEIKAFSDSVAA